MRERKGVPYPPSANSIWEPRIHKKFIRGVTSHEFRGMKLTDAADEFEKWFMQQAARELKIFSGLPLGASYWIDLWMYVPSLKNKSNGEYKPLDSSNRLKFLEDVVARAIGYNDAQNLDHGIHKREDPDDPRIELIVVPGTDAILDRIPNVLELLTGGWMTNKGPPTNRVVLCDRHDGAGRKTQHQNRSVCASKPYRFCRNCPNADFVLVFRLEKSSG